MQIVGLGRVGLPLAVAFARAGHRVLGMDVDAAVRAAVEAGRAPFAEPGLDAAVADARARGLVVAGAPAPADVHVIAVPTPLKARRADLEALWAAVAAIELVLGGGELVVLESTCPPGTAEAVAERLAGVDVATATERVLPGRVLEELAGTERVVGGVTERATARAAALYASVARAPVSRTDARTAEVVKLVENAYRDVNLAFANEVEMLCHELGVRADEVIALANRHPRVDILRPGPGVGGHCLPVDPWFLVDGRGHGALIRTARAVNEHKVDWTVQRVLDRAGGRRVACLGLTYKAGVDDLRNAPALEVVTRLRDALPGRVRAVDPLVAGRVPWAEHDVAEVVAWSELVVALVAHPAFRALPEPLLATRDRIDLCGLWAKGTGRD